MAIPAEAKIFLEPLDPTDITDFQLNLSGLLESGESIASQTLSVPTESSLLGLEIKTTGGYVTTLAANILTIWLGILIAEQGNAAFVAGVTLPIEITVITNSTPPRKKQRTFAVKVIQR